MQSTNVYDSNSNFSDDSDMGQKNKSYFWRILLLGIGFALAEGIFIARQSWDFAIILALMIPVGIIVIKQPFVSILIWLLVFPYFVKGSSSSKIIMYWLLHRLMMPVVLGWIIISNLGHLQKKIRSIKIRLPELSMILYVFWVLINVLLLTEANRRILFHFYDYVIIPFSFYFVIRLSKPSNKLFKPIAIIALFILLIQTGIGMTSWFAPQVLPQRWLGLVGQRTVGSFGNPAVYTCTLVFLTMLFLSYTLQSKKTWVRNFGVIVFIYTIFSVFFSFSRGSWFGIIAVLIVWLLIRPKMLLRTLVILIPLMIVLGATVLADEVEFGLERINETGTIEGRIMGNIASQRMIENKPFFGWGFRTYDRYDEQFKERIGETPIRPSTSHNTFLTVAAETGIFALFLYLIPPGYWLIVGIRRRGKLNTSGILNRVVFINIVLFLLFEAIVINFMDMFRFQVFGTTLWWIAIGLMAYVSSQGETMTGDISSTT